MAKRVGVIGCGIMGGGMARRLLHAGFPVVVYNRTEEKVKPLVQAGAIAAGSPAEVAAQAETVVVMLRDDTAVRTAVLGPEGVLAGAKPGTTIINTSTVTPSLALELGPAVEQHGCRFLDVPVTGSRVAAAEGKLGMLASGRDEVIEAERDVLSALGTITKFGPLGRSSTFKLANNQLAAVVIRAIGEGIAMCEAAGLDRAMVVEALTATVTRVGGLNREKLIHRDWSVDFALNLMLKDLDQAVETAANLGVRVPLAEAAREIYRKAERSGKGAKHFAAVVENN
jgi:3-hydroxyisobutyrate dehydrogenase